MRFARFLFPALVLLAPAATLAAELELVRVWSGPRTAESFERISEYFDGQENTSGQTVLRSQPAQRAGYYWLIRTRTADATAATVELAVLAPGESTARLYTFATRLPGASHVTMAGLTGADWPDIKARPVAWRLRVLGPDGRELAAEQSFLWTGAPTS